MLISLLLVLSHPQLDDWVLCRIYKKSSVSSPGTMSATSDQEQEEEGILHDHDQYLEPNPNPNPNHDHNKNNSTTTSLLQPQKSMSFSNLLDAMDYSMLSNFLSENPSTLGLDAPNSMINNACGDSYSNDHHLLYNSASGRGEGFSFQMNNNLQSVMTASMDHNRLKRQVSGNLDEEFSFPSKKIFSSCSTSTQSNMMPQLNKSLLNQQLLLSPHLQF